MKLWLVNPDDEVALADALRRAVATDRAENARKPTAVPGPMLLLSTRQVYASVAPRVRVIEQTGAGVGNR